MGYRRVLRDRLITRDMSSAASLESDSHPGRIASVTVVVLLVMLAPRGARGEVVTGSCATVMDPNNAPSTDPRIDHLIVDGVHVNVMVPPRYRVGRRRYPVVYLFHGAFGAEDSFFTQ